LLENLIVLNFSCAGFSWIFMMHFIIKRNAYDT
jgi:hypothetical protein